MTDLAIHQDYAYTGDAPVDGGVPESDSDTGSQGSWPRMLNLDTETEDRLLDWIDAEVEAFFIERQDLMEDWKRWQRIYWAEPDQKVKNFPFKRAANVVIPLAALAVEAIHARFMNTLFAVEPFWSIRARTKEWADAAKPFEQYLQSEVESSQALDMYKFCNEWLMEFCKLGTGVIKTGYDKIVKKGLRSVGDTEEEVYHTVKNGGTVARVPLGNFIMRFSELDPQMAPMVGERHNFSWSQLKRMAQSGRMSGEAVEKIKQHWVQMRTPEDPNSENLAQQEVENIANTEPTWTSVFKVDELWVSFDVDKDGWDEEIVIDYHKPTRTILSIRYNWYEDLHRPYHLSQYLNVEGIWPGIGLCKMTEQFQEEATTIHRQRLDNATLANMAQIAVRKGLGYKEGEPIFPGKMWFVDNVQTDIKEFKLSEVYPSAYNNEDAIVRYFEKRTSVNEVILGIPQEGTPGTATSDLTRLAEGNKRFDLVLKNVKRTLSLVGYDVISNMQTFGNGQVHWLVVGDDGIQVEKVLQMPYTLVRHGAIVDLTVTDSITNREVEQRQWLQLFQVLTNYYAQVFQLTQLLAEISGDPTILMQVAQRALVASDAVMRRMLETFTIPDAEEFSLTGDEPNVDQPGNAGTSGQPPAGSPLGLIAGGAAGSA